MNKQLKKRIYLIIKRILDLVFSSLAILILAPIFLIIYISLKVIYRGDSVLFKQERVGFRGKKFNILKFRTMVPNAESILKKNKEMYALYVENGYKFKTEDDPRITNVGKFLRKSSLDELPQFLNIIKGEMSLVGPRPIIEQELEEYGDNKDLFLSVKPGAMGLWQAKGRSEIDYPKRAEIELEYVKNAGLFFDVLIIIKNIVNIILRKGAF